MIDVIGNIGLLSNSAVSGFVLFAETLRADGVDDPVLFSALGESDEGRVAELLGDSGRADYLALAQFRLGQFHLGRFSLFAPKHQVIARAEATFASISADGSVVQTPAVKGAFVCMAGAKAGGEKKSESPYLKLGEEVRRLRKERGLKQMKLAHLAGMSSFILCRIEKGKLDGRHWWLKLATALGLETGYFHKKAEEFGLIRHPLPDNEHPFARLGEEIERLQEEQGISDEQLIEQIPELRKSVLWNIKHGMHPGRKWWLELEKVLRLEEGYLKRKAKEFGLNPEHAKRGQAQPLSLRTTPRVGLFAELGEKIAELRVARGLTQKRVAQELGITFYSVCRIESGRNPGWRHHATLEKIFDLKPGYFKRWLKERGLPTFEITRRAAKRKKR